MSDKIFVQIVSYRDPELLPTIRDCIANADRPDDLTFGIVWQHSPDDTWDTMDEFKNDPRFRIADYKHTEAKGTCWARSEANKLYKNEKYTLQIDSHHRFVKGWDTVCKDMVEQLIGAGHKKPLLSAFLPAYEPNDLLKNRSQGPWKCLFDKFTKDGVVSVSPAYIEDVDEYELPVPSRFIVGHFVFTLGSFINEVPYDPSLYFYGEEMTTAVRAFTNGYDLFFPNKLVGWHYYCRTSDLRHWDDNEWVERNNKALLRAQQLLGMNGAKADYDFGKYGFGKERTVDDYTKYSGIRFSDCSVQQYTLEQYDAPNPIYINKVSEKKSYKYPVKIAMQVWKESITERDYDVWVITFKDENDEEIHRMDATEKEIKDIMNKSNADSKYYEIEREFYTKKKPHTWCVWPHSREMGWTTPIYGMIGDT